MEGMYEDLMIFLTTYSQGYTPESEGFLFLWITASSGLVGVVLIVERYSYLIKRASINSQRFMLEITKMISTNKIDLAIELCDAEPEGALPRICKRGLQHAGTDSRTIQTAVDAGSATAIKQASQLYRYDRSGCYAAGAAWNGVWSDQILRRTW